MSFWSDINWRLHVLRICLGALMLWFGVLKFLGPMSVSDALAVKTIRAISLRTIPDDWALIITGALECVVGAGLFFKPMLRYVIPLLAVHIIGTSLPLILFTCQTWKGFLFPTFEGQYIIKNVLIAASAIMISIIPEHNKEV